MDELSVKIGNRIKQLRQEKGVSQEELALASNLNRAFLGQIERGQKNATVKTLEKICIALDISLHNFFSFEIDEIDFRDESIIKIDSMLKQLDEKQASQLIGLIRNIIDFSK